jgi:transcriptional regulator with XRE-family HTH domain
VKNAQAVLVEKLAEIVKARRKQLRLSQEELAHLADIDRTYASQIERAVANPSLSVLCSLASVLKLSLSELLGEIEIKP